MNVTMKMDVPKEKTVGRPEKTVGRPEGKLGRPKYSDVSNSMKLSRRPSRKIILKFWNFQFNRGIEED